jgi:hypothetical protein
MALSGLDSRLGKVVEAEIQRRFSCPVSFDSHLSAHEFFLVLSFDRCKFRLSEHSAALILQSVIGGHAHSFNVIRLDNRVFRFSVHSQEVGFHIYKLRSFECSNFKIFFNLWHNGGPNFEIEFRNWESEQAKEWVQVATRSSKPAPANQVRLTGANSIPIPFKRTLPSVRAQHPSVLGHNVHAHNSVRLVHFRNSNIHARQSAFTRFNGAKDSVNQQSNLDHKVNGPLNFRFPNLQRSNFKGILGPHPSRPVSKAQCCLNKACLGHNFGRCQFPPRLPRTLPVTAGLGSSPSTAHRHPASKRFLSFSDFSIHFLGLTPPPPLTIPWSRT